MINKSRLKQINKKIIGVCLASGMTFAGLSGLAVINPEKALAYVNTVTSTYFSDATFKSYSGSVSSTSLSQDPATPSQWTLVDSGKYDSSKMSAGIFYSKNISSDNILKRYKLIEDPGVPTNEQTTSVADEMYYSLALSAPNGGNFGYKASTSKLTLNTDSFYEISVVLKTSNVKDASTKSAYDESKYTNSSFDDTFASIYLTGFNDLEANNTAKFECIRSRYGKDVVNDWGKYTFYIATNNLVKENNLNMELWLGSKTETTYGSVLFNSISVQEIDQKTYENSDATKDYSKKIDLRNSAINYSPISNSNFVDDWHATWESSYDSNKSTISVRNDVLTNNRSEDLNVLYMEDNEDDEISLTSVDTITIAKQSYYKLSVWGKSDCGLSSAGKIVAFDADNDEKSAELTICTSVTDNANNGWTQYSFYVYGDKFENKNVKLKFVLQQNGAYAYFDNISLQSLNYSEYSNNNSGSNATTLNFNSLGSETISNYSFDITENETTLNTYPLTPANWAYEKVTPSDSMISSGIVSVASDDFNNSNLTVGGENPVNPGTLPYSDMTNNNVLYIAGRPNTSQTYTSNSFTMDANSYYLVSIYVNATRGGADVLVSNNNGYIYKKSNITTGSGWTLIEAYIKTANSESEVTIKLSLNNTTDGDTQFVFFDEVNIEKLDSSALYDSISSDNTINNKLVDKIDLNTYNFDNQDLNNANGFTASSTIDGSFIEVQDLSQYSISAHSGENALVVFSNNAEGVEYFATTNRTFSFDSSKYYKVSVFVRTLDNNKGGATIKITGESINKSFTDITSNGWTEYDFFIKNASDTVTISLGLGNSTTKANGYAMFDDVEITELSEDDFTTLSSTLNSRQTLIDLSTQEESNDADTSKSTNESTFKASFNWYIVTSLVTALAVIIAVVGTLLRKVKIKPSKKIKNSYDRRKTLDVDLSRRERIEKRKAEIKALEDQLAEIEKEIENVNKEIEQDKKAYEELKRAERKQIEERKLAITKEKEQALHERNEKIAKNKNAFTREEEEKFLTYIKKLEKAEAKEALALSKHDKNVENYKSKHLERLHKYLARQQFIKAEIARIDAEIEAIAKEEAAIWEEYKQAKADAKRRKAEYKASLKAEKQGKTSKKDKKDNIEIIEPDKKDE